MKQILKFTFMSLAVALGLSACTSQDIKDNLADNLRITDDQVSFSYAASSKSDNILIFTNTSDIQAPYTYTWDLGNGVTSDVESPTGMYPDAGDYTVTFTVFGADGSKIVKTQSIHIAKDDPTLFDAPVYVNLTGGADNVDGRTWVFDQYNQYVAEVKAAVGTSISGHIGLGPLDSKDQEYWAAGPNEKSYDNTLESTGYGWTLYDWKITFKLAGLQMNIVTAGEGYGRKVFDGQGGHNPFSSGGWNYNDDIGFKYDGGDYTYSINEEGPYDCPQITLSGNAFMGYYCGSQVYDIIYQTDEVMALRTRDVPEDFDWVFVYIRSDLLKNMTIPDDQVTFEMTPGSDEFTYNYSVSVGVDPNDIPYTVQVDFGDGTVSNDLTGSHEYIVPAGTYTAKCTVSAGNTVVKEQTITIGSDNPKYNPEIFLTGNGKSWKLRPVSEGSGIIMTRAWTGDVWWTVDDGVAGSEAAYDDVLTFFGDGKAKLDNHGDSFMNESTASLFSDGDPNGSFVTTKYVPSDNATWSIFKDSGKNYLKLDNVFPMYAVSPDVMTEGVYEILSLRDDLLVIRYVADWGAEYGPAWNFYLVPAE